MTTVPTLTLNDGRVPPEQTAEAITSALDGPLRPAPAAQGTRSRRPAWTPDITAAVARLQALPPG